MNHASLNYMVLKWMNLIIIKGIARDRGVSEPDYNLEYHHGKLLLVQIHMWNLCRRLGLLNQLCILVTVAHTCNHTNFVFQNGEHTQQFVQSAGETDRKQINEVCNKLSSSVFDLGLVVNSIYPAQISCFLGKRGYCACYGCHAHTPVIFVCTGCAAEQDPRYQLEGRE